MFTWEFSNNNRTFSTIIFLHSQIYPGKIKTFIVTHSWFFPFNFTPGNMMRSECCSIAHRETFCFFEHARSSLLKLINFSFSSLGPSHCSCSVHIFKNWNFTLTKMKKKYPLNSEWKKVKTKGQVWSPRTEQKNAYTHSSRPFHPIIFRVNMVRSSLEKCKTKNIPFKKKVIIFFPGLSIFLRTKILHKNLG